MIAIYFSPLYILANFFLGKVLLKRLSTISDIFKNKIVKIVIIVIFIVVAATLYFSCLLSPNSVGRNIRMISFYFLAVMLYYLFIIGVLILIKVILQKTKLMKKKDFSKNKNNILSIIFVGIIILIIVVGTYTANNIVITRYNVDINKKAAISSLKIAEVADLHLGYNNGYSMVKKMVEKINKEKVDVVIIAGDIFDNEINDLNDTTRIIKELRKLKSTYGSYAVYGNHDVEEKIILGFTIDDGKKSNDITSDKLLKEANITILKDQYKLIANKSIYLYGRIDYQKQDKLRVKRASPTLITSNMDKTKPIIVIDHQPHELEDLARAGVDLDLSGHTHDGQVFPVNAILSLCYKNSYGYKKIDNMNSIVTSGVGVFGPHLRLGTKAEVVIIKTNFSK